MHPAGDFRRVPLAVWQRLGRRTSEAAGAASEVAWLRGRDLNPRPPGYEPDELPGCSTPRCSSYRPTLRPPPESLRTRLHSSTLLRRRQRSISWKHTSPRRPHVWHFDGRRLSLPAGRNRISRGRPPRLQRGLSRPGGSLSSAVRSMPARRISSSVREASGTPQPHGSRCSLSSRRAAAWARGAGPAGADAAP